MSAQLSRRFGRVASYPPIFGMPLEDKVELNDLTLARFAEFDDLPERYRQLILEAEAIRERHLAAIAAGTPHLLDHLWDEAAARVTEGVDRLAVKPARVQGLRSRLPDVKRRKAVAQSGT